MNLIKLIKYKASKLDNNYILFCSFNGKYADSPKALTEYIHKFDKTKKLIWLVNDVNNTFIPSYVEKVEYNSKKAWDYYCKSKIIIDNVYGRHEFYKKSDTIFGKIRFKIGSFLKYKKGQYVYTTWHGTPIKKMGVDSVNNCILDFSCPNTTMILDNQYTCDIMKRLTFGKVDIKLLGSPKNDILFNNKINLNNLKKQLNLPINKKIVLFAPSFRTDSNSINNIRRSGIDQINMMDIKILCNTLKNKFNDDWSLVCRFHYHVKNEINWQELKKKYGNQIINGNEHEDIMEYLKCSDVLITDISSCLFDFALMDKPIFILFPDYEYYKNEERGLYLDFNKMPFNLATSFTELINNINAFNQEKYIIDLTTFMDNLGYAKETFASKKVA